MYAVNFDTQVYYFHLNLIYKVEQYSNDTTLFQHPNTIKSLTLHSLKSFTWGIIGTRSRSKGFKPEPSPIKTDSDLGTLEVLLTYNSVTHIDRAVLQHPPHNSVTVFLTKAK